MSNALRIERRFAPGGVSLAGIAGGTSATGTGRTISGTAVKFNMRSLLLYERGTAFVEVMLPGAFDDVLKDDVIATYNHSDDMIMARSRGGVGTLKLRVDGVGLHYEFEADPEQTYARNLIVALRRGDINGSSFAFSVSPGGESWQTEKDGTRLRTIRKVSSLRDVSVVSHAAYGDNTSAGVRNDAPAGEQATPVRDYWAARLGMLPTPTPAAKRTEAPSYIYKPPRDANGHRIDPYR